MQYKDYYKILGVTPEATEEELTRAFKESAMGSHPDLNPSDTGAENKIKEINEAYAVLRDPVKRLIYDAARRKVQRGKAAAPLQDTSTARAQATGVADAARNAGWAGECFEYSTAQDGGEPGDVAMPAQPAPETLDPVATLELSPEEASVGVSRDIVVYIEEKSPDGLPVRRERKLTANITGRVQDGSILCLTRCGDATDNISIKVRVRPPSRSQAPNLEPTNAVVFEEKVGSYAIIELQGSHTRLNSKIIGWKTDEYVLMEFPDKLHIKQDMPKGKDLIVRYLSFNGNVYGFKTFLIDAVLTPVRFLVLGYPSAIEMVSLRGATRVQTFLPAAITNGKHTIPGYIVDLSTTGCRFEIDSSAAAIFVMDSEEMIRIDFRLKHQDQTGLTIPVKMMKTYKSKKKNLVTFKFLHAQENTTRDITDYVEKFMLHHPHSCTDN